MRIALDSSKTEVTLWGDACQAELDRCVEPVRHRLSLAAREFKAHALAAAGTSDVAVGPIETSRSGVMTSASIRAKHRLALNEGRLG